jgi:hypothetical protein
MIDARKQAPLRTDLLVVLFLIGLDVAARLLPHTPNFMPLTASALFAGMVIGRPALGLLVPLAALLLSDLVLGFDDWRIALVVYLALALPVGVGMLARHYRLSLVLVPAALVCSLIFFVVTNFAVWAFGSLYSHDMAGLTQCYLLALPFLKYTMAGDLAWTAVLFGGAFLVQRWSTGATAVRA